MNGMTPFFFDAAAVTLGARNRFAGIGRFCIRFLLSGVEACVAGPMAGKNMQDCARMNFARIPHASGDTPP